MLKLAIGVFIITLLSFLLILFLVFLPGLEERSNVGRDPITGYSNKVSSSTKAKIALGLFALITLGLFNVLSIVGISFNAYDKYYPDDVDD